jgi:uncharacterized Ntn-hydrolase superfamily protein
MTFSIVACDPVSGELGVAVESKFLAVGAMVPWARAGVGAVATQAFADVTLGPRGLALLAEGVAPALAVEQLLATDPQRADRQVGIVAANGQAASFTGPACMEHAASRTGAGYAAQGNILASPTVVDALATAFLETSGPLGHRLVTALEAGQAAGGDRRGQQSAALLVVKAGGGYGGNHDRYLDLRVDDHPAPIDELRRLLGLHHLYFDRPGAGDLIPVSGAVRARLRRLLDAAGALVPDGSFGDRLWALIARENLEERWVSAEVIDRAALDYLDDRFGKA